MASRVTRKTEVDFAWLDNRDQVRLDIRKAVRRIEYAVLEELEKEFAAGINRGEILNLRPGEQAIAELLKEQAIRAALEANGVAQNNQGS